MVAVGKVFGAIELMAARDRVALSGLLRPSHGAFPLLPAEIDGLEVPSSNSARAAMLRLFDGAIAAKIDRGLARMTLEQIVPLIARVPGSVEASARAGQRLSAAIHAHGSAEWSTVARYRVDEVRGWPGAGAATTIQLVQVAVHAAVAHFGTDSYAAAQGTLFDERSAATVGFDRVLAALTDPRQRAMFEYVDLRLDTIAPQRGKVEIPASAGQPRRHPTNAPAVALTWSDVADLVDLSINSCQRLRLAGCSLVRERVEGVPELSAVAARIAAALGEAAQRTDLKSALRAAELPGLNDPAALLALWLAGPYLAVPDRPGWFSPDPTALLTGTRALLAESGGVHDRIALLDDLTRLGVSGAVTEAWLAAQPVAIVDDLVVLSSGRVTTIVERVLDATGRAMTATELFAWLSDRPDRPSLGAFVETLRRASGLVEVAPDRWELADWGAARSEHLVKFEVEVTEMVLTGDTAPVPADFVSLLALHVGIAKPLPTRFGPLTVAYDGEQAVRQSVRPVALACGAPLGATMVFVIDPRLGTAEVEVIAPTP